MKEDKKYSNSSDDFAQVVKEKLENHSVKPDDALWAKIEQDLHVASKQMQRQRPVAVWLTGLAAAVAALVVLVWTPFQQDKLNHDSKIASLQEQVSLESGVFQNKEHLELSKDDELSLLVNSEDEKFLANNHNEKLVRENTNYDHTLISGSKFPDATKESDLNDTDDEVGVESGVQKEVAGSLEENTANNNNGEAELNSLPDLNDYPDYTPSEYSEKRKHPIALSASVGASGFYENTPTKDAPFFSAASKSEAILSSDMMPTSYAHRYDIKEPIDKQYLPEISVTLSVVKSVNKRFAFETGLKYSYLQTNYTKPYDASYYATSQLYYIGIPLNLKMKLLQTSFSNLYISGGGAVEKGILSSYNQKSLHPNTPLPPIKNSIEGLQWSLSGGLGIDLKIAKQLRLFAEPKLNYYFDNFQPESARTANSLSLNINGGLRIEF